MRIAQIADLHFTALTWNPFRLLSKRFLGHLNWICVRRKHFFEKQLQPLPQLFEDLGVDLVLLGGDLSTTALFTEFEKAAQFVGRIKQPWLAIPGNHDHYTHRSYRHKHFYRYFTNPKGEFGYTLKDDQIEAHHMGGWWFVALDTAVATAPHSSQGLFSEQLEQRLQNVLRQIPRTDSILMVNHYPFFCNDSERHSLMRREHLQAILTHEPRIRLYLHGHTHRQSVADLQASNLPLLLDSGSCAQGRKGAWNLIDLTPTGSVVSTYRWDHKWTKTHTEAFAWTR